MSFWYPYRDGHEATTRLSAFADSHVGLGCGITWSDGQQVALLRAAHAGGGAAHYLNVLCHRGLPPPPPAVKPVPPPTFLHEAEEFAWSVLKRTHLTPDDLKADAQAAGHAMEAGAAKVYRAGRDNIWEPVHRWMIDPRHKSYADGFGVAMDVVGVIAGAAFFIGFAPEIGALAVATGVAAAGGSALLLIADGMTWGAEITGNKDFSERWENSRVVQWMRIVGTVGALSDIAVGGPRALKDVHKLGKEIEEGLELAGQAEERMAQARASARQINRAHPDKANKLRHQANVIAKQAAEHRASAHAATVRRAVVGARDAGASYVATPVGAALFAGSPPSMLLTKAQQGVDRKYLELVEAKRHPIEPEGGMPRDAHLEVRVSALSNKGRRG